RQLMLGDGLYDSIGLTAQGKRILGTRGLEAEGEHPGNRVCLVADRQQGSLNRARGRIFRRLRLVLVVNDLRDELLRSFWHALVENLHARVESSDDSLQFGELLH